MSEQTSRDEAVRVGKEAILFADADLNYAGLSYEQAARAVLDAAHTAGLVSYPDEWEQVTTMGDLRGASAFSRLVQSEPLFARRRVSFEAGEEVNEEQT